MCFDIEQCRYPHIWRNKAKHNHEYEFAHYRNHLIRPFKSMAYNHKSNSLSSYFYSITNSPNIESLSIYFYFITYSPSIECMCIPGR